MPYGLFVIEIVGGPHQINRWIRDFDVDALEGRGSTRFARNPEDALQFDTFFDALKAYRTQSTVTPLRDDGQPNRPLTAYTVEIKEIEGR